MVKFTDHHHGWITFFIDIAEDTKLAIDFSDAGPNSLKELQLALSVLPVDKADSNLIPFMLQYAAYIYLC